MHPTASLPLQLAFSAIAVAVVAGVLWAARSAKLAAAAAGWLTVVAVPAFLGLYARFELRPPPLAFVVVGTVGLGAALGRSQVWQRYPLATLVLFQAFRLPLELVMHAAAGEGVMPTEMSYSGYNFDIVTGASAIGVWFALRHGVGRWVAVVWSVVGTALLATIVCIALLALPMVRFFGDGPHLNTWVAYFPFVYLPAVCVLAAIAGHVAIWTNLLTRRA